MRDPGLVSKVNVISPLPKLVDPLCSLHSAGGGEGLAEAYRSRSYLKGTS